jgi:GTP cyclohydrolase II
MLNLSTQTDDVGLAAQSSLSLAGVLPDKRECVMRARSELHLGLPVVLVDGDHAYLVALSETMQPRRFAGFHALGAPDLALTQRRAEVLGVHAAGPICVKIPATATLEWVAVLSGKELKGDAPAKAVAYRPANLFHKAALMLAQSVESLPAVVCVALAPADIVRMQLPVLSARDVMAELGRSENAHCVSRANLPTRMSQAGKVHVFRTQNSQAEHYAIEIGTPDFAAPVLVRMHSACFTGDVLGSLKCDCGPQLAGAMAAMSEAGGGVLLYLNQEGRGIGLANKMRAYALQDGGLDTVEANHWLGFEDDMRDFAIGAEILRRLQIDRVRLMTNNPAKVAGLSAQNITIVARVPLHLGRGPLNDAYLATKAAKSGHILP